MRRYLHLLGRDGKLPEFLRLHSFERTQKFRQLFSSTWLTCHPVRSWLNLLACLNMLLMSVTLLVSHATNVLVESLGFLEHQSHVRDTARVPCDQCPG